MKKTSHCRRVLECLLGLSLFAAAQVRAAAPAGAWWDGNYTYRQQLSVAAGASALVSAYSTSVTFDHATQVTAGRSVASGNDVRVVYWNGTTWVELDRIVDPDSAWNSATSKIWFVTQAAVASGATDDNYYLYYGFAGSSTPSSTTPLATTANIFLFYDDFSGAALDTTTRWTNSGATQAGSVLTLNGNTQIRSQATFGNATIWETRAKLSSASAPSGSFSYWAANSSNNFTFANDLRFFSSTIVNHTAEDTLVAATTQTFAPTSPTAFQLYAITREGTTTDRFLVNGTQVASLAHTASNTALRILLRNDAAAAQTQQYQWARVRNYRNPEPVASLGGQATFTPVAIASYSFEETTTWNGTAGEVKDSSANALNGSAKGTAVTANTSPAIAGVSVGTCRYATLNGTSSFVQIPTAAPLNTTTAFGVAAWVRHHTNTYKSWETILAKADSTYRVHLNGGCNITGTLGTNTTNGITEGLNSGCTTADLNSNQIPAANTWYHVGATYRNGEMRIYINGALINSAAYSPPTLATAGVDLAIGENLGNAGRFWDGDVDEVTLWDQPVAQSTIQSHMAATHACTVTPHFTITHDGYGINCLPERITVNVLDPANNPYTGFNQTITLSTGTTSGTWSVITGAGTLSTTTNGNATYQWSPTESTVIFGLSYPISGPITPSVSSATVATATAAALNFGPSGFTVTTTPVNNSNPITILPFASPQIAGTSFPVYLTAYGTTPTDTQCGVIESYTNNKSVKFWSTYANPATGTRTVSINGTSIATVEASSVAQTVNFINGQATVTVLYKDAGQLSIGMKDDTVTQPVGGIRGGTGNFVSRPSTFVLSNIKRTDTGAANPGAANGAGLVFLPAGRPFSATVTALESGGTVTPNFGLETPAESVALTPNLVLPSGGQNPAIAAATGFGTFAAGVASGIDFSWPEVGIITLTPHIKDLDYLGAGDFTGTTTTNVGRFIPDNFLIGPNTPSFQTACNLGGFTYLGQPFVYSTAPVLSVTARAFGGQTTRNYTGAFFKLTNTSINTRTYSITSGTLDTTGLPATSADPAVLDLTNGLASLTFSAGSGLAVTRTTPSAPMNAVVSLSVNVADSDGVVPASNPQTFSSIAFTNGNLQRYGRVAFRNAVGSELLNLPLPMHAEYFFDTTSGFIQNSSDTCTTGVTLAFANYGGNLSAGETCLLDTGSPGVSGLGCAVAAPLGQRFQMPPTTLTGGGDFIAILKAPGAGNNGTVTVTTTVPTWLRYDWNTSNVGLESPSGVATFGIFQGESKRIFQIEK